MFRHRKHPLAAILLLGYGLIGLWARGGGSQPLPTPYPEARYEQIGSRSPFAIATATAPAQAAPTPGFAAQLYVDGVARVGESDFVAIKSRDPESPMAVFVEVGKSTRDGITVNRVNWSTATGKSTVEVTKGGEKATLLFDEQQIAKNATAAQQAQQAPPPPRPGIVTRAELARLRRTSTY